MGLGGVNWFVVLTAKTTERQRERERERKKERNKEKERGKKRVCAYLRVAVCTQCVNVLSVCMFTFPFLFRG